MTSDIETKGFIIEAAGDPSVGIFSSRWEVSGDFIFMDKVDLAEFKAGLIKLFSEHAGEPVGVCTMEENERQIKLENQMLEEPDD